MATMTGRLPARNARSHTDAGSTEVPALSHHTFVPRGSTPLLDATGLIVARAQERTHERHLAGRPESIVLVTITDGHENASRGLSRDDIRKLVAAREAEGWVFVYLSAGLDTYDEARSNGYHGGAVQSWAPDSGGASLAFTSLGTAMSGHRGKLRRHEVAPAAAFFEAGKPAEQDRRRKRGDAR
jgi:hypothetical protein